MKTNEFIILNNIRWKVLSWVTVTETSVKRGEIEAHLKGKPSKDWLITHVYYHVTVRWDKEDFDRIFVLSPQEAKQLLFPQ